MTGNFRENWITAADVDQLILQIKSNEKCKCILNPLSSYIPNHPDSAELGGYVAELIKSYMEKRKPDFGLYACPKVNHRENAALIKWWKDQKK